MMEEVSVVVEIEDLQLRMVTMTIAVGDKVKIQTTPEGYTLMTISGSQDSQTILSSPDGKMKCDLEIAVVQASEIFEL